MTSNFVTLLREILGKPEYQHLISWSQVSQCVCYCRLQLAGDAVVTSPRQILNACEYEDLPPPFHFISVGGRQFCCQG